VLHLKADSTRALTGAEAVQEQVEVVSALSKVGYR
jgi:hypothetical protein